MPQFQTVTIQGKGLFSKNMTLTLTDKWLIVKDSFGGEVMRLSPSQANMRVEAFPAWPLHGEFYPLYDHGERST